WARREAAHGWKREGAEALSGSGGRRAQARASGDAPRRRRGCAGCRRPKGQGGRQNTRSTDLPGVASDRASAAGGRARGGLAFAGRQLGGVLRPLLAAV